MKKKDLDSWKTKSLSEALSHIAQLEKEKTESIIKIGVGKIKNVHSVNQIKKDIARLKTIAQIKKLSEKLNEEEKEVKGHAAS